jgi:hypothetical protein
VPRQPNAWHAFGQWWLANAATLPLTVDTYYGTQSFDAALERTTWHVAQHVRQLELVLHTLGGDRSDSSPELLDRCRCRRRLGSEVCRLTVAARGDPACCNASR